MSQVLALLAQRPIREQLPEKQSELLRSALVLLAMGSLYVFLSNQHKRPRSARSLRSRSAEFSFRHRDRILPARGRHYDNFRFCTGGTTSQTAARLPPFPTLR